MKTLKVLASHLESGPRAVLPTPSALANVTIPFTQGVTLGLELANAFGFCS